ncbi:glycine betaine ABC transporter substrate-binding protein [Desulfosporosinus sp. OT]|uniref:glycine betaine ABC transporter substrate-binding protein n=1 Tax=Desulfosporosinus sp. OT TaxID=913865 RepID=UPI000223A1CC|nr:glycine betaine ABC transporter substrate-binding protein [Desulfosporosinus sp. OT]EGW37188.1 substrate binding domain of ABC-type glycine betaine transport system family protein [Desulfosporosinus sp. OT]
MKLQKSLWKRGLVWSMVVAMITVGLVAGCGTTPAKEDAGTTPSENKTVNIGYVNWAEDVAVSNIWKVLLEEKGYQVNLKSLDVAPLFVGLNKGDLDVFMDAWLPITHQSYWDKYKDNLDDYGTWYKSEAKIGLVVPKYVDINSIEEMKAKKDQFDGKIIGIDPGAGIMKATSKAVGDYGIDYEVVQSSEAAMMTALDKAYRDKKWIAVTGWSPHWMFAKYDLKYLEDPKADFGSAEQIHTLANKNFTTKNPDISKMLKAFKLDDQQIGSLESLINGGMQPEEAAKKWITDNKDLVDGWMK